MVKGWKKTLDGKKLIRYQSIKGKEAEAEDISGKPFVRGAWSVQIKDTDGIKIRSSSTTGKSRARKTLIRFMREFPKG